MILSIGLVLLGSIGALILVPRKTQPAVPAVTASPLLDEADAAFASGQLLEAKQLYKQALETETRATRLKKIQEKLEAVNINIILSPLADHCSTFYTVKPNDVLGRIARRFNTTITLVKTANNLTSDTIRPGQQLKINTCLFSIVVDKSQNRLFLKRNGEVVKTYQVSTGKDNSTPAGTFRVGRNKLKDPTWYKTGAIIPPNSPQNILGSRWIGIEGADIAGVEIEGYGIHGTTEPDVLGRQVTLGCIRMSNADVEELFDLVPVGTEVIIVD